ncbi:hypothetical protein [Sulfurovum sp.]|uniref:hypothetical protein n=1 Tax=Sulfurovum sp. TaxID=1969726 RepID=UPI0025DB5366|nr:hypothetical protein [Sulfurovum sp.]
MQRKNLNTILCRILTLSLMFLFLPALADPPIPIDPRHRTSHVGLIIDDIRPVSPEINVSKITYFQINKGDSITTREVVKLNHKIMVPHQSNNFVWRMPTHYRVSQFSNFYGAEWKPYNNNITYDLGNEEGEKTVYFQVGILPASGQGITLTSNIICDSIELRRRREFKVGGLDVYAMGQVYGFTTVSKGETDKSISFIDYQFQNRGPWLALMCYGRTSNDSAQCDFTLFDGKELKEGWVFKSVHFFTIGCEGDGVGFMVREKPIDGSRKIRFRLGLHSAAHDACEVIVTNITLEGPGDGAWMDAFR